MNSSLEDQKARQDALDINRSFIVQAPAGSGKTELLILRFLRLLLFVDKPEHVLSITFTRKAASEMRGRIIEALLSAEKSEIPVGTGNQTPERNRLIYAKKALKRDSEKGWEIIKNPTRLRIQTIDSFCLYLSNQLPILSRSGGSPQITQDPELFFQEAVLNTLFSLETEDPVSIDIENMLLHLDNDTMRLQKLLIDLLYKREQWLPYIFEINSNYTTRQYLNDCIKELVHESIVNLKDGLMPFQVELERLIKHSTSAREGFNPDIKEIHQLPGTSIDDIPNWQWIVSLLLTKTGAWRKTITKDKGFLSGEKQKKDLMILIEQMSCKSEITHLLNSVKILPTSLPDSEQWTLLNSLTNILLRLSSELIVSFRNNGVVDYTEVSLAAKQALGGEDSPTDLTLALDHKIKHILIDEFQDTSRLQLEILTALVAGWAPEDQRSLFLVGDPMQSCYSFRNANVGIFLDIAKKGLPNLNLESLQLNVNFRSSSSLIDWVNKHFISAFPSESNLSIGAVPFSPAISVKPSNLQEAVTTQVITYNNNDSNRSDAKNIEALMLIKNIKDLKKISPSESIAVLVRNRRHLNSIIPELDKHEINWESNEIDNMGEIQIVEDLINLTKALLNPHDRLSWLALLRAPWVGLTIRDLHTVAQASEEQSIWESLNNLECIDGLTKDGRIRLDTFVPCALRAMSYRYQIPLIELIQSTWRLFSGDSIIRNNRDRVSVTQYFEILEKYSSAGGISDFDSFQDKVRNSLITFTASRQSNPDHLPIQVLTVHKAKGLEFDHVIIPGLADTSKNEDKSILLWHERINEAGRSKLLISPINSNDSEEYDVYKLIKHEKKLKISLEETRLLYIAITRARSTVKLLATAASTPDKKLSIPINSLLARVWSDIKDEPKTLQILPAEKLVTYGSQTSTESSHGFPIPTPLRRFKKLSYSKEAEIEFFKAKSLVEIDPLNLSEADNYHSETIIDAKIGELIHEILEDYAIENNKTEFLNSLSRRKVFWKNRIKYLSSNRRLLNKSVQFIYETVEKCIRKKELNWIFNESNNSSQSEFQISWLTNGKINSYIIDRTFIDENGVRWIIDYKTGVPRDESVEAFIEYQKEIHTPQLKKYCEAFKKLEKRKTKAALLLTSITRLVTI